MNKIKQKAKYHEEFEKSKGSYTVVADDPETRRILENTKIISQVKISPYNRIILIYIIFL